MYIKITKNLKTNYWSGLSRVAGYNLEKDCLLLLEKNFECTCGLESYHFPIIKNYIDDEYTFELSDCGTSLDIYQKKIINEEINPYKIYKLEEQIECIIKNLKKNNIKHLDMHLSGKNICITEDGIISLIDFDIASIDDFYLSKKISKAANDYGEDYYNKIKEIMNRLLYKYSPSKMKWAWITPEGMSGTSSTIFNLDGSVHKKNISYYACADLPDEVVMAYSVEETNEREKTGIKHNDRMLNTRTKSGKKCSGEVTHFVCVAYTI